MKKINLMSLLVSSAVMVGAGYAVVGCGSEGTSPAPHVIVPITGSLQVNANIPQKAAAVKKMSVKAETAGDIVTHVHFTITGDNIVGSITKQVDKADFVTALTGDTAAAAIRINDLMPGNVDVTVEAQDSGGLKIASATLSDIAITVGSLTTSWLTAVYNNDADAGIGFSWLIPSNPAATPTAIPTPTATPTP